MEIYSARRPYQPCTFTHYSNNSGIKWGNNRRNRPRIRRFCSRPVHHISDNWPAVGNFAYGRRPLDIVVYNKTAGAAGSDLSIYLGRNAFTFRVGMGICDNLAVFRLFTFVSGLAKMLMVACDIGHNRRTCVSEHPAHNRGNFHSIG